MRKLHSITLLLFLFGAASCTLQNRPQQIELYIIETSDVHGSVFDYNFITQRNTSGSLSKVNSYVKGLKDTGNVILLDNGDILQGQPIVYYYNYEKVEGEHICSRVMNYMQYDAATIGNHDVEAGHKVYDKIRKELNFPWLAANAINKESGKPYFDPYVVLEKEGVRIAVLGLITPGIPDWLPEELWEGIEFEDMVESAKKWVPIIYENENPDLLIGLFHAGVDYTYGDTDYDSYKNENASRIVAEQVPGFDIVFVGHDHQTWNEKVKNIEGNEVLVLGPTSGARQIAQAHVKMMLKEDNKYSKQLYGQIIKMDTIQPDTAFNRAFQDDFQLIKDYVSRKVGVVKQSINTYDAIFGPSIFMDLIHDIQLDITKADISFAAPLSFRDRIEAGPLYVSDMFKLYRFENFLYTISLSGEEIDKYLEYSFGNWFNTMSSENDNLLQFKKDEKGKLVYSERYQAYSLQTQFYNFDVAGGIKYTVSVDKPMGDKVEIHSFSDNAVFYNDSIYKVAVNSYRGNGGGGHFTAGVGLTKEELNNRRISSTDKDLRYYMMKWIESKDTINPVLRNEWTVEPYEWWIKGTKRDKKLLK